MPTPQAESLFQRIDPAWEVNSAAPPAALAAAGVRRLGETGRMRRSSLRLLDWNWKLPLPRATGPVRTLFKITEVREASKVDLLLASRTSLTRREAEVLLWVQLRQDQPHRQRDPRDQSAHGETKHLEQVFRKLGVGKPRGGDRERAGFYFYYFY